MHARERVKISRIIGYSSEKKVGREDCRHIKALENKYRVSLEQIKDKHFADVF